MGLCGSGVGLGGGLKLYFGGVLFWGFWGGGVLGGSRGGSRRGGVGGGCVHQNTACTSEVPGGCAKPTDLSNY